MYSSPDSAEHSLYSGGDLREGWQRAWSIFRYLSRVLFFFRVFVTEFAPVLAKTFLLADTVFGRFLNDRVRRRTSWGRVFLRFLRIFPKVSLRRNNIIRLERALPTNLSFEEMAEGFSLSETSDWVSARISSSISLELTTPLGGITISLSFRTAAFSAGRESLVEQTCLFLGQ